MFGESKAKGAFEFLEEEFGFRLRSFEYAPEHFGNFIAEYVRDGINIVITRDRNQVFVEFTALNGTASDKEDLLEQFGILRDRHPTEHGLWTGYELEHQARELREYLPRLLTALKTADQSPPPN